MTATVTFVPLSDLADLAEQLEGLKNTHQTMGSYLAYSNERETHRRHDTHLVDSCARLKNMYVRSRYKHHYDVRTCVSCLDHFRLHRSPAEALGFGHAALQGALRELESMVCHRDGAISSLQSRGHSLEKALEVALEFCGGVDAQYGVVVREISQRAKAILDHRTSTGDARATSTVTLVCAAMLANGRSRHRWTYSTNDPESQRRCDTLPDIQVVDDSVADHKFTEWLALLEKGISFEEARENVLETLWVHEIELDQMLDVPFLSGKDFSNPQEWVQAEWRHQVRWHAAQLVDFWQTNTEERLRTEGDQMLFLGVQNLTSAKDIMLVDVLSGLGDTYVARKNFTYLRTTKPVADWALTFSAKRRHKTAVYVEVFSGDTTPDMIEVALALYEPGSSGAFRNFREALVASQRVMD